jgi:uncharacterized damage-inducible protein DinB
MAWTAPDVVRVDEPFVGPERAMLDGWLDWHRATFLRKCSGLTGDQLALRSTPPSSLSLLGLIRHHTDVERSWLRRRVSGESVGPLYQRDGARDNAFDDLEPLRAESEYSVLVAEQDLCRRAVVGHDLDDSFVSERHGEMSLRWVLIHLIEEYARHNGHADLLRERIDGSTGD